MWGQACSCPACIGIIPATRGDAHGWPISFLQYEGSIESNLRGYLLAAVWIGGGLLAAIAILRRRPAGFAPGFVLGTGLFALASFLGLTLSITQEGSEPLGPWSAGPGYFLGVAGGLLLILTGILLRVDGSDVATRSKVAPFLGVAVMAAGLVTPVMYRNHPEAGSVRGQIAEPIVSFDGHIGELLFGYLVGAALVGGGLWAAWAILRSKNSFAPGVGFALGLGALATFLGYVLLITMGPNEAPYPEGGFSVGIGFFLGIAGALFSFWPVFRRAGRSRTLREGAADHVALDLVGALHDL